MKQSGKNTWSIPTLGQQFGWYRLSTHLQAAYPKCCWPETLRFQILRLFPVHMDVCRQWFPDLSRQFRAGESNYACYYSGHCSFYSARHVRTGESSLVALCPHSAMLEFCSFLHLQFWDERCSAWGRLVLFGWALGQLVAIFGKSHWELGVAKQLSPWELQSLE